MIETKESLQVWVYEYNWDSMKHPVIQDGDYLEYLASKLRAQQ